MGELDLRAGRVDRATDEFEHALTTRPASSSTRLRRPGCSALASTTPSSPDCSTLPSEHPSTDHDRGRRLHAMHVEDAALVQAPSPALSRMNLASEASGSHGGSGLDPDCDEVAVPLSRVRRRGGGRLSAPPDIRRSVPIPLLHHELPHGGFHRRQFILRAEHHKLCSRHRLGNMPWRYVERVARLDDLLAVAVPDGEAPRRDIAPVWALAAVARQPLEQGCEVPVLTKEVKMTA
jgi:hypothetical protein